MMASEKICQVKANALHDPVFNVAGVGLALLDFEGRFLRVNPALQRLFGTTEAGLLGTFLHEHCPPNHARICFDLIQEMSLADKAAQDQELSVRSAAGRQLWVHVTATRHEADAVLPSCIVLTVHDSSDYFELQEEMRAASRDGCAGSPTASVLS